jgi:SAM-dependent methyltransferase
MEKKGWRSEMTDAKTYPPVLDACCGSRMFWFEKADSRAVYVDKRRETHTVPNEELVGGIRTWEINPDTLADFTSLPFPSDTFMHVVFDPPHMTTLGQNSYMAKYYGRLTGDWREMLRKGFAECFRVLRPEGTLVFKWCEYDVPVSEVLSLTPEKPLYGHRSGKHSKTHWIAFLKPNKALEKKEGEK